MDNMDKKCGNVPNEVNRKELRLPDERTLFNRSHGMRDGQFFSTENGHDGQGPVDKRITCNHGNRSNEMFDGQCTNSEDKQDRQDPADKNQDDVRNVVEVEVEETTENVNAVKTEIRDDGQIENKDDKGALYEPDDFQISHDNDKNNHPSDLTDLPGPKMIQSIDEYDDLNKMDIKCSGNTISSCFNMFSNTKDNKEYLNTAIQCFFKVYDFCRPTYDKFCHNMNYLSREFIVCPLFYESSSEFESENESSSESESENELSSEFESENEQTVIQRHENESALIGNEVNDTSRHENQLARTGLEVEERENGLPRQSFGIEETPFRSENGVCCVQNDAPRLNNMQPNEESRQENEANQIFYLSDYGNTICHPTDEIDRQWSDRPLGNGHSHPDMQARHYYISSNSMVVTSVSTSQLNLGHTTESSASTPPVPRSGSSSEVCHFSSQIPDRNRVPQLCSGYIPNCTSAFFTDSFEDKPVLLANPVGGNGFQETCTLDPGLMILLYQMLTNPRLLPIFTSSPHSLFNRDLPELLDLFRNRMFEGLRQRWADMIHWLRDSFYGMDTEIMMPPFSGLLNFSYTYTCTNTTCPLNNTHFDMPDICLRSPAEAFLDCRTLQHLIDRFQLEETTPCCEIMHSTRPDQVEMNPLVDSYNPTFSYCCGTRITHRRIDTSVEQPPVLVLNMARSSLTRDQIGDLNGTVHIGGMPYYVGGVTFSANNHSTARILLPHRNIQLFFDNLQGVQEIQNCQLEPACARLSLIFLFRQ